MLKERMKQHEDNDFVVRKTEIIGKDELVKVWDRILKEHHIKMFGVLDIDGTADETDQLLREAISEKTRDFALSVFTGKSFTERRSAVEGICYEIDFMVCQNGAEIYYKLSDPIDGLAAYDVYVVALKDPNMYIDVLGGVVGSDDDLCIGEHFTYHIHVDGKEYICIPVADKDYDRIAGLEDTYGNLCNAYREGALKDYHLAVSEYIKRGMPDKLIKAIPMRDIRSDRYRCTEMTFVADHEDMVEIQKKIEEKNGLNFGIQANFPDRIANTRGAKSGKHPSIMDISEVNKGEHITAMRKLKHFDGVQVVAYGNAGNDEPAFRAADTIICVLPETEYAKDNREWEFGIMVAKDQSFKDRVIFVDPKDTADEEGKSTLVNPYLIEMCEMDSVEEISSYLDKWLQSCENEALIEKLIKE